MNWLRTGETAAIGTAILWTLSALAWTSAGKTIGVVSLSFIRLVITCPLLLAYSRAARGLWLPSDASAETWFYLSISGFVGFFLADLCLLKSFMLIGPRLALLVFSLSPPFTAILSRLMLGDALAANHWIGMAVTLAGVVWVVLEESEDAAGDVGPAHQADQASPARRAGPKGPSGGRDLLEGIALAVVAAAGQALGMVLAKRGMGDYHPVASTFIRIVGGLAGYLVLVTVWRGWADLAWSVRQTRPMMILAFGAFVGPFLGVVLYMVALQKCHPGVVATIISTMPVLILPLVIVLYHEKVSPRAVGGAVMSVVGVAILVL